MTNRQRQIEKDIATRHEQAAEEYAKNKHLMGEEKARERLADSSYIDSHKKDIPKDVQRQGKE